MRKHLKFYIDGQWVDPVELKTVDTINPATEEVSGTIALGSAADVDRAVKQPARPLTPGRKPLVKSGSKSSNAFWLNIRSALLIWPRRSRRKWARRNSSPVASTSDSVRVT